MLEHDPAGWAQVDIAAADHLNLLLEAVARRADFLDDPDILREVALLVMAAGADPATDGALRRLIHVLQDARLIAKLSELRRGEGRLN